jgi:hypothetical protein
LSKTLQNKVENLERRFPVKSNKEPVHTFFNFMDPPKLEGERFEQYFLRFREAFNKWLTDYDASKCENPEKARNYQKHFKLQIENARASSYSLLF